MRKLVYSAITTLDGFVSNEYVEPWHDIHAYFNQSFDASDAVIFDQQNHELLVPYWDDLDPDDPDVSQVEREFAVIFRTKTRYILDAGDRELEDLAIPLDGDAHVAIVALKEQPGSQLLLATGPEMFALCLAHGLVDELEVIFNPIISGKGEPAFGALDDKRTLRLLETRPMEGGAILAKYAVT
jgi:dihydrofolate reductase